MSNPGLSVEHRVNIAFETLGFQLRAGEKRGGPEERERLALDQLTQLARGAIMDAIGLARKFPRSKQAVDPPQILPNRSLAGDGLLQAASAQARGYVIDEAVGAQVDAVLPEAFLEFFAFEPQQGAIDRDLDCFASALTFGRHIFIST